MESEKKTAEVIGESPEMVELTSVPAMIEVPENCVKLILRCTVMVDGKEETLQTVERTLSLKEIQFAIREAETSYFPDDAVFTLTDKGRALAESMEAIDR